MPRVGATARALYLLGLMHWLRAFQHALAKRRIRRSPRPRRILVVCHGNICRSPYMEAALRRSLPDVEVASAGFVSPGRQVPAPAVEIAGREGLDLRAHRSRLVNREMLREADLIVVMDAYQSLALKRQYPLIKGRVVQAGDLDPDLDERRDIRDPFRQSVEVYEASYARLRRSVDCLRDTLPRRGGSGR